MLKLSAVLVCVYASFIIHASEEKIRGVLEKTAKGDACAQLTDALNEIYYVSKSDAAEKMIAEYVGKNVKVQLTGTIENKPNEPYGYINLKEVAPFVAKLPPAPPPPPVTEKKEEPKKEEPKKEEVKKDEPKKSDDKK